MEDRKLTEKESLELISQMIRNTQTKMEQESGTMLLIWGYTTIFVTIVVWISLILTRSYLSHWLWFLIPVIGGAISYGFIKKRKRQPSTKTYIDRFMTYIWSVLGAAAFLLSMIAIFVSDADFPILFVIVLLMSIGTTLTGLTVRFMPITVSGIICMLLSLPLLFVSGEVQMLIFLVVFLIMMIIPGHILNNAARKQNKERG